MNYHEYGALIADNSGAICYISDIETYELLYLTKPGLDACGIEKLEDCQGQKCHKVLQGLDQPCPFCTNNRLAEGQEYRWEHHYERLDRWFDITNSLVRLDGRLCRLEIAKDVTGRRKDASLQTGDLSMEDILFRCLHTLTREGDLDVAVNQFLEAVGGYYQAARAYIFEFDLEGQTISNTFEWCRPGVTAEIGNLQKLPMGMVSGWIKKFQAEGVFSINSLHDDLDHQSEDYRILESQGIRSLLAAPLLREGEIVGFIGVDDPVRKAGNLVLLRSVSDFVLEELEKRRLIAELEYMSYIDSLTGLKNRNQFTRVLRDFDRNSPGTLGIVTLDINGLRGINDTHGQSYGDYVVKQTGKTLQEILPNAVFRTGGDEFVALCVDMSKKQFQDAVVALRNAFDLNRDFNVSIGCSWAEGEVNVNAMVQQADELRNAEKQSYYHSVLREGRTITRSGFASEVLQEIEDNKFVVFYQPQVNIKTGEIIGAEALVRKKDDDGGLIPPGKFIPFYEVGGVISYVDLHVMRTACATMRQWLDRGHSLHLSVNFSRVTLLESDIVETISGICAEYNVPPALITIEVTESISKMDHEQLKALIKRLTGAGFTISLDDFGSQYSNLAILAAMDFDEIKFDKTLVNTLEENRKSRVVMENSIHMCHGLEGTSSLAEGIETRGQLELLADYQCDYGQGYYFSKPVPLEEFDELLEQRMHREGQAACS